MTRPIVIIGDTLMDRDIDGPVLRLSPDAAVPVIEQIELLERPGGAGFAAMLAARDGASVTLVTALADDEDGNVLRSMLRGAGVNIADIGASGTTICKTRVRASGNPVARVDSGSGTASDRPLPGAVKDAIAEAKAILVSDYGNSITSHIALRHQIAQLDARVPVVWDPHPRGSTPLPCTVATPNLSEAFAATGDSGSMRDLATVNEVARTLRDRWQCASIAITMNERGALLCHGSNVPTIAPAPTLAPGDPCGAGDRFATTLTLALASGALVSEAVVEAVDTASRFVAAGGMAGFHGIEEAGSFRQPIALDQNVTVATGGCFDLLHAGHVHLLKSARRLGDKLVVLLNSDSSVRHLKGVSRPINNVADRTAVLMALGCVDEVVVFDEETPSRALRDLRPQVWVKGGDYSETDLPEIDVMKEWGGQVAVLPYLEGRSTTGIVNEVLRGRR